MADRLDAVLDLARAEREYLRWLILSVLWHGRPYGVSESVMMLTARDVLLRVTSDQVRAELCYLEKRGLVKVDRRQAVWHAELTADGESVVDYRIECPPGIARPQRG